MSVWRKVPFFFIVLFLSIGIALSSIFDFALSFDVYKCLFYTTIFCIFFLQTFTQKRYIPFLIGAGLFIYLGIILFSTLSFHNNPKILTLEDTDRVLSFDASISKINETSRYSKVVLDVHSIIFKDTLWPLNHVKLFSFFTAETNYSVGDKLSFDGCLESFKDYKGIDMKAIYQGKGIQAKVVPIKGTLSNFKVRSLYSMSYYSKNYIKSIFKLYLSDSDDIALLNGMFFGDKADMDKKQLLDFIRVGVMHVFTVSGLHVGLIYLVLIQLLNLLGYWFKKAHIFKWFMVLIGIWSFVLLTGSQVSVVRAAIMLSFIATGQLFKKQTNTYNALCASAFFLLLYNPMFLFQVGFQLSYAAVFGILFFYKRFYDLIFIPHKWIDKIWQLFCVNMSAWLMTLPFLLYYFDAFSTLSVLTGIIIIPLVTLAMIGVLFLLVLHFVWPFLATYCGFLLEKLINLIIYLAHIMSKPSFIFIEDIHKDIIWGVIFLVMMIVGGYYLSEKRTVFLYTFLLLFLSWISYDLMMILKIF